MGAVLDDKDNPNVQMLDDKQAMEFFANLVKCNLGISVAEFFARYKKGEYKDACDNPRLMKVLMMIPKAACCGNK